MVLKVQCEKCGTKYKLDESRVKGRGARITCPSCKHVFVVYRETMIPPDYDEDEPVTIAGGAAYDPVTSSTPSRPAVVVIPPSVPSVAPRPAAPAAPAAPRAPLPGAPTIGGMRPPPPGSALADLIGEPQHDVVIPSPSPSPRPAPAAPRAAAPPAESDIERPRSAEELNWRDVGIVAFKVKVAIGLVYDFSDVGTLKKYLSDKKVQPSDKISMDGRTWVTLHELGDLDTWFIDQWVELKRKGSKGDKKPSSPPPAPVTPPPSAAHQVASAREERPSAVQLEESSPRRAEGGNSQVGAPVSLTTAELFDGVTEDGEPNPALAVAAAARRAGSRSGKAAVSEPPPPPRPMNRTEKGILGGVGLAVAGLGWLWIQAAMLAPAGMEASASGEAQAVLASARALFPSALARAATEGAPAVPQTDDGSLFAPPPPAGGAAPAAPAPASASAGEAPREKKPQAGNKPQSGGVTRVADASAQDFVDLGDASAQAGDYGAAIEAYRQAVAMKPGNGAYHARLGHAQQLSGDPAAAATLQKAVGLAPRNADAWKWLGQVQDKAGKTAEAIKAYKRYLELAPRSGDAAAIRQRLAELQP